MSNKRPSQASVQGVGSERVSARPAFTRHLLKDPDCLTDIFFPQKLCSVEGKHPGSRRNITLEFHALMHLSPRHLASP